MRDIVDSTDKFEAWMRQRADISGKLLDKKHKKMTDGAFPFLRATFYRWVEQWPEVCPELARRDEDVLLAVGDLHVENFGVWRNSLGDHVWGVNDFDDACELPFTSDLVRLAASIDLAARQQGVKATAGTICRWVLGGYRSGLAGKGRPFLVSRHKTLAVLTRDTAEKRGKFWKKKLESSRPADADDLPKGVESMFEASFPRGVALTFLEQKDPGGLGSLGRRRYTALAGQRPSNYEAREAKALVPSALYWVEKKRRMPSQTATLLQHAYRSPDPYFQVHDNWLVRRFAPDVAKIELPKDQDDPRLPLAEQMVRFMGAETANIHLGSRSPADLQQALQRLEKQVGRTWLVEAAEAMAACTVSDFERWEQHENRHKRH